MMPGHRQSEHSDDEYAPSLRDAAFEPWSSFNFGDELCHLDNNIASFSAMDGYNMDSNLASRMYDEDMSRNFFGAPSGQYPIGSSAFIQSHGMSNVNPSSVWQNANQAPRTSYFGTNFSAPSAPESARSHIVNSRSNHVSQQCRQTTPPVETGPKSFTALSLLKAVSNQQESQEDISKLNKEQRARNAANKRHSKTRKAGKESGQDNNSKDSEGGAKPDKGLIHRQEKNRLAATKCRSKKKKSAAELQERAHKGSSQNSYWKSEHLRCKNELTYLRNRALQHRLGRCNCTEIHHYNIMRAPIEAQRILGWLGSVSNQPMLSPSQQSVLSFQSPGTDSSARTAYSVSVPGATSGAMRTSSRPESAGGPLNYAFFQVPNQETTQTTTATAQDLSQMPQHFGDLLQSSANGRGGFF